MRSDALAHRALQQPAVPSKSVGLQKGLASGRIGPARPGGEVCKRASRSCSLDVRLRRELHEDHLRAGLRSRGACKRANKSCRPFNSGGHRCGACKRPSRSCRPFNLGRRRWKPTEEPTEEETDTEQTEEAEEISGGGPGAPAPPPEVPEGRVTPWW